MSTPTPAPAKNRLGTPAILAITCLGLALLCLCACVLVALLAPATLTSLPIPGLEGALEQYLPAVPGAPPLPGGGDDGTGLTIELPEGLASGVLTLGFIEAAESAPFGPILQVEVTNDGNQPLRVAIPCGTVLLPQDPEAQRLMIVQPALAQIDPGETEMITVYVVCIDSTKSTPEAGAAYRLGQPAQASLAKFADCVCREKLSVEASPLAGWDLQLATWMVADDASLEEMLGRPGAEAEGALGELFGGELGAQMQTMLEGVTQPAQEWLDRCQIEPGS